MSEWTVEQLRAAVAGGAVALRRCREFGRRLTTVGVLVSLLLIAAACGDDVPDHDDPAATTQPAPAEDTSSEEAAEPEVEEMMEHLGDGSLGVVEVEAGDAIQIRSLQAITGDVAFLGLSIDRATQMAVEDYGPIHGFDVDTGTSLDSLCSNVGGQAAAQIIVADEDVVGVVGTSCSGAAVAAAPLITDAGMVLISGSNTSPALTSDLVGTAGPDYSVGYYRTAHNDLYQGAAMARFVFSELGISTAAAIHDGDPYTQGLAQAFADAFEAEGGTITGFSAVNKDAIDMVPVLTEIAAGSPGALFFPIFEPAGSFISDQAPGVSGLEETVLLAADGLLNTGYLSLPQTTGMYFSGPDQRFGENVNQSTGKSAVDFLATYEEAYGEKPAAPFWAHGYDATTLLLDAIAAASWVEDGDLMIDRQGIRDHLNSVQGYQGLTGTINCDAFGDCGAARIAIVQNIGGEENAAASLNNVVFPQSQGDSERQICVTEHALMVWAGQQLEESAFSAIEKFTEGDVAAAQAEYDQTARVADSLPEIAAEFGERCRQHTPGLVSGLDEAVQLASAEWRRLREGCEQGPAMEGFNC